MKYGIKTTMKGLLMTGWMLLASGNTCLSGQDLHIYYDLFTDSLSYRKNGELIPKPKIRKGDLVVVHFTEFNPYIYNGETEVEQFNGESWGGGASAGGSAGLMPGIGGMLAMLGGGPAAGEQAAAPLSILDVPLLQMGQTSVRLRDLFGNSRGTAELMDQAKTRLQELAQTQSEMAAIYEEIQNMEKAEKATRLAYRYLDQALYDPRIKPSILKRMASEYMALVFPGKSLETIQVEDAFQWQERPAVKRRLLQALEEKQRAFDAQMLLLAPVTQQLSNLDAGSEDLDRFARDLRGLKGQAQTLRQQFDAYLTDQTKKQEQTLSLEQIMALVMKCWELNAQSFSFDCAVQMEKDYAVVKASFTPLDTLANGPLARSRSPKRKTLKLEARGGLHIGTGVGVSFASMFDPVQEYTVRENVIVADQGSAIQPAITTFLHFYANSSSSLRLAGTFGLGIPLSSANLSSLNFYLGPSLIFGRNQRIVLTGGINASPVARLGKGFKEGDPFDLNQGDIPTRNRYELGAFVGISFNMGG